MHHFTLYTAATHLSNSHTSSRGIMHSTLSSDIAHKHTDLSACRLRSQSAPVSATDRLTCMTSEPPYLNYLILSYRCRQILHKGFRNPIALASINTMNSPLLSASYEHTFIFRHMMLVLCSNTLANSSAPPAPMLFRCMQHECRHKYHRPPPPCSNILRYPDA